MKIKYVLINISYNASKFTIPAKLNAFTLHYFPLVITFILVHIYHRCSWWCITQLPIIRAVSARQWFYFKFICWINDIVKRIDWVIKSLELGDFTSESTYASEALAKLIDHYRNKQAYQKIEELINNYQSTIISLKQEPSVQMFIRMMLNYLDQKSPSEVRETLQTFLTDDRQAN